MINKKAKNGERILAFVKEENNKNIPILFISLKNEIRKIEKNIVEDSDKELERFHKALEEVINETNQIVEKARGTEKEIMTAYLMIMQDPSLILETESQIKNSKINAEYATEIGFNSLIQIFENIDDEYMSGRSRDIADIKDRIISKLYNEEKIDLSKLKNNTIIVAKELTTSDTAKLDFKNISGIITEVGGENSHTSIMARTHLLPAVTKVENATTILKNGEYVAINGGSGEIFENPTEEQQQNLIKIQKDFIESKVELEKYKNSESKTKDGFKVELVSNIGTPADVELVLKNTAEGIGFFRREFLKYFRCFFTSPRVSFTICSSKSETQLLPRSSQSIVSRYPIAELAEGLFFIPRPIRRRVSSIRPALIIARVRMRTFSASSESGRSRMRTLRKISPIGQGRAANLAESSAQVIPVAMQRASAFFARRGFKISTVSAAAGSIFRSASLSALAPRRSISSQTLFISDGIPTPSVTAANHARR